MTFGDVAENFDSTHSEDLLGDRTAGDATHGFTSAGSSRATPIAGLAVSVEEVDLGVSGSDDVFDVAILSNVQVLGIDIADHHAERSTTGDTVQPATDDLYAVGFQTRRVDRALSRATFVELFLNLFYVDFQTSRDAIDDRQQSAPIASVFCGGLPAITLATG